ncbi:ATP synthase F1 subunit delta [Chloroflexota bacterium]
MARRVYPKRYAQAVFNIALERKELDRWQADLRKIASLCEDAVFMSWLESPKFHFDDKAKLVSERLGEVNPLALNLVYLLITRGRLSMVGDIVDEYQRLLDSYRGIEHGEVITAVPLDDKDKLRIEEHLSAIVGKKVVLKPEVDSDLVSGVIVRIGGKLLDGSTRSQLEALRRELASAEQ